MNFLLFCNHSKEREQTPIHLRFENSQAMFPHSGSAAKDPTPPIRQSNDNGEPPNQQTNGFLNQNLPTCSQEPREKQLRVEVKVWNWEKNLPGIEVCQDMMGTYTHWNTGDFIPSPRFFLVTIPDDRLQTYEAAERYIRDECTSRTNRNEWGLKVNEVWRAVEYTGMFIVRRITILGTEYPPTTSVARIEELRVIAKSSEVPSYLEAEEHTLELCFTLVGHQFPYPSLP